VAWAAFGFVGNGFYEPTNTPALGAGAPASADVAASAQHDATPEGGGVRLPVREALKALTIPKTALRDPFAPRAREDEANPTETSVAPDVVDSVHLSALWTQGGATYTLINDRICQVGDKIGRLQIESATQDGVWISHWKGRDFISLGGDFTLRTPALAATL